MNSCASFLLLLSALCFMLCSSSSVSYFSFSAFRIVSQSVVPFLLSVFYFQLLIWCFPTAANDLPLPLSGEHRPQDNLHVFPEVGPGGVGKVKFDLPRHAVFRVEFLLPAFRISAFRFPDFSFQHFSFQHLPLQQLFLVAEFERRQVRDS